MKVQADAKFQTRYSSNNLPRVSITRNYAGKLLSVSNLWVDVRA